MAYEAVLMYFCWLSKTQPTSNPHTPPLSIHSSGKKGGPIAKQESSGLSYIKSGGDRCRPRQSFARSVLALFFTLTLSTPVFIPQSHKNLGSEKKISLKYQVI